LSALICAVAYFLFSEGKEIFLIQFFTWVGKASSYHSFGLAMALCGCGMCLLLGGIILYSI